MLLTYLDESYTKDRYYIAAVACPDDLALPLADDLDQVVLNASKAYATSPTAELHGHALFQARDDWEDMASMVRARIGVYDKAMQAIGRHGVKIFLRGVDVLRLTERYANPAPPHSLVLQHVMERVNDYAREQQERVLFIADEICDQNDYRQRLWEYRRRGTPGYRSSTLDQVVDTIHFAPSHASRLLQAADLIAFLHRRRRTHIETDPRAHRANERIWGHVVPRVIHDHTWWP